MSVYEQLKNTDADVIIFGAGNVGRFVLECCRRHDLKVAAFCDNSIVKAGNIVEGVRVDNLKNLVGAHDKMIFIIASSVDVRSIIDQITEDGVICTHKVCTTNYA